MNREIPNENGTKSKKKANKKDQRIKSKDKDESLLWKKIIPYFPLQETNSIEFFTLWDNTEYNFWR